MADIRPLPYEILWNVYDNQPITDVNFKWEAASNTLSLVLFIFIHSFCKHRNFSLAIEFMWTHAFLPNKVYRGIKLKEVEGMKAQYEAYCLHILRNECSVMMLSEDYTQIRAVVLLEWMTEEWHSWWEYHHNLYIVEPNSFFFLFARTYLPSVVPKGLFQELIRLKKDLMVQTKKQNEWEKLDSLMVLEIGFQQYMYDDDLFQLCIFDVFAAVAQHMEMPRVCFIALTKQEQTIAEQAMYDEYSRSIYSIYKVNNKRPFDVLRDLNEMHAVNFLLPLEPILFYKFMPGFEKFHEALEAHERKEREEEMGRNAD